MWSICACSFCLPNVLALTYGAVTTQDASYNSTADVVHHRIVTAGTVRRVAGVGEDVLRV